MTASQKHQAPTCTVPYCAFLAVDSTVFRDGHAIQAFGRSGHGANAQPLWIYLNQN